MCVRYCSMASIARISLCQMRVARAAGERGEGKKNTTGAERELCSYSLYFTFCFPIDKNHAYGHDDNATL